MRMQNAGHNLSPRWLGRVFGVDRCRPGVASQPPIYLCPALWTTPTARALVPRRSFASRSPLRGDRPIIRYGRLNQIRSFYAEATLAETLRTEPENGTNVYRVKRSLPENCAGCGAFTQITIPGKPGYYNLNRRVVKEYLGNAPEPKRRPNSHLDDIVKKALEGLDLDHLAKSGVDLKAMVPPTSAEVQELAAEVQSPVCDRCHDLKHNANAATSIMHPDLDTLMDTVEASPYKYNHIYHVLDAADFPMSLLPKIRSILEMMPLRSHNRRSMGGKFSRGRKMELSFIITRSDLLGNTKDQVDSLMPYLREVLRDALGRLGKNVRLGNLRCVSAKRNWWTTELRNEIYERGGACWMVGKVNVGKSALFAEVFPKGHTSSTPPTPNRTIPLARRDSPNELIPDHHRTPAELALLPAARSETNYPAMPVRSTVPGTTAAPIRIPFGNGKGELIDLPGITRGDLASHVKEDKRPSLIMTHRIWPEQQELPYGRSLLLGGFIRITPKTPNLQFLAYSFTPIEAHAANTSKCIAVQEQAEDAPNVENISLPGTGSQIKSAGVYPLQWDVTAHRAGSVIRAMRMQKDKMSQKAVLDRLPFRVLGVDILIEGCGWVELVVQVRKRQYPHDYESTIGRKIEAAPAAKPKAVKPKEATTYSKNGLLQSLDLSDPDAKEPEQDFIGEQTSSTEEALEGEETEVPVREWQEGDWPAVEVFTPEGRFISSRRPMNAWIINKPPVGKVIKRQRRSMKGDDKRRKAERRGGSERSGHR